MITSSVFDLTNRDDLLDPSSTDTSINADFFNKIASCLQKIESYGQNTVTLNPSTSKGDALSPSVQQWTVDIVGPTLASLPIVLPISPAILEDAGLVPCQTVEESNPQVSLQNSVGLSTPTYLTISQAGAIATPVLELPSGTQLPGNEANLVPRQYQGTVLNTPAQPGWATTLQDCPLWKTSVRLIGAINQQVFELTNICFFDAGDGTSPCLAANIEWSLPSGRGVLVPVTSTLTEPQGSINIPIGIYEITLMIMNWVS